MLTTQAKLIIAAVLALLLGAGVVAFGYHERQVGALKAEVASLDATVASLKHQEAKVDTVFRADTVALNRVLVRYDTARVHDTVTVDSVVYVERAVADSAVKACTITLAHCEEGWRLATARADTLARLLPMLKPPPTWPKWALGALGLAAGFFAGRHFK